MHKIMKFFIRPGIIFLSIAILILPFPALAQSNVTLRLNNIQVIPIPASGTYDVSVFFSLLDSAGNPIKNAAAGDFKLSEDNQPVVINSLARADEPINIAILMDTSGSMAGDKINSARSAASNFIDGLRIADQVAVLTFDKSTTHRIDFTLDHTAAKHQVAIIPDPIPNSYTCLYDAAYQSIRLISNLPSSQRAIVLLTDGKDEGNNQAPCSIHTLEDVIDLASSGKTKIPIYTIGLGDGADKQTLERMANETAGRYLFSPATTQLEALFNLLGDELRQEYVLQYTSAMISGEHTLTLQVNYMNAEDTITSKMDIPAVPYSIIFTSPTDTAEIIGKTSLNVKIFGQGPTIHKVIFLANNASLGADTTAPYTLEWDPIGWPVGSVRLQSIAVDAAGTELASSIITVTYKPVTPTPTLPAQTPPLTSKPFTLKVGNISIPIIPLAVATGVLMLLVIITILFSAEKRHNREKLPDTDWDTKVYQEEAGGKDDHTIDSFTPSENALGVLFIRQCDNPDMLHRRIEIVKAVTQLGRKADNDIIFANETPVSRYHAKIEAHNGQLLLSEVLSEDARTGRTKRPAYGTFVNGNQVQESVILHDGDEIILGKRLQMCFEAIQNAQTDDERTVDQVTTNGGAKTVVAFANAKADFSASNEKTVADSRDEGAMLLRANDKAIISSAAEKTVVSKIDDKPDHHGDDSKTFKHGAR